VLLVLWLAKLSVRVQYQLMVVAEMMHAWCVLSTHFTRFTHHRQSSSAPPRRGGGEDSRLGGGGLIIIRAD
jgi:hypothetical protein